MYPYSYFYEKINTIGNFAAYSSVNYSSLRELFNSVFKMALDFICAEIIMQNKKINIPVGANCYRYGSKKRVSRIKFFRVNPHIPHIDVMKEIPEKAKRVCFPNYEEFAYWTYYGDAIFYDENGKVLK